MFEQRRTNVKLIAEKQLAKTHCSNGHEYTEENTGRKKNNGSRICKTCHSDASYRFRQATVRVMQLDKNHRLHGTYAGYQYGCHCFRCRCARSEYHRKYREKKKVNDTAT